MFDELRALYRDTDALFEGASCDASTECCRFGITGREPQVTSIEIALIEQAIKQRGGPLSVKKRALPLASQGSPDRERICPMLDRSGRCTIYRDRPLGCRTFYCSRASLVKPPTRDEIKDIVRRLQDLAARHEVNGDRPRALTAAIVRP
ncbi:MAG: YkgJ family cysteine cluster protein [Polyangiaceae bacterium]